MNAADSQGNLSLETLKRLDSICAAYEGGWHKDAPPRFDEFLGDAVEPERGLIFRELLKLDAELRGKAGMALATDELRRRFPEYSELITALESQSIATDATVPPREQDGGQPDGSQTVGADAGSAAGMEDLQFLAPPTTPGSVGRLGHYDIHGVVGRGGMGVVLKAFDERLHRIVAIKVLGPQFATSAAARKRFDREARAAAAVSHDHIVPIYHVDEFRGVPFLVMPLIVGKSLQDRLDQDGALGLKEILRIGNQIAEGLAAAHKKGLVHRDIKPGNILLENGVERVKITDFGLARAVDDASVTQSGVITGTPMFMAPEQARGETVDHRADLFSLGSVLYAMCTGHPPFRATGTHAVLMRVIEDTPRPIQENNPELPEWLGAIIAKLHAKKPEDRFQSAREVAELLEQYLAHVQQPATLPRPAALAPAAAREGEPVVLHRLLDATDAWQRPLQHFLFVVGLLAVILGLMFGVGHLSDLGWTLAVIGGLFLFSAAMIRQRWVVDYRGHRVRFESSFFFGESLFLDDRRLDRGYGGRRQLRGKIDSEPGRSDDVVASAETSLLRVRCRIGVESGRARPTGAESVTEESRPAPPPWFPWRRLAWMIAGYAFLACVLFAFIVAYSENGWWSTPWIEFSAAPVLLVLAVAHLFVRPRWLAPLPLLLAIFVAALGWVLWPYATARYFTRQVHDPILTRGYVQANRMLTSGPWVYTNFKLTVPAKDGRTVTFSEDDFPLDAYDADLDHFLEQQEDSVFRFRITSTWAQDRYCELKMAAGLGTVRCEAISFHHVTDNADPDRRKVHLITEEEWTRAHDWP